MSHKIGWCDNTINPCWGCKNHCGYCYARDMAKRFGMNTGLIRGYTQKQCDKMMNFELFLFPDYAKIFFERVNIHKPAKFFIGDMSEIAYWKWQWIEKIITIIKENNKRREVYGMDLHVFQFLTKNPLIYNQFNFPENCWLGWTITKQKDYFNFCTSCGPMFMLSPNNDNNIFFASFEPLHGPINENIVMSFDWIIIGAETGIRKGKKLPKFQWIEDIYQTCGKYDITIYMKDNLHQAFPDLTLKQEFPDKPPLVPLSQGD